MQHDDRFSAASQRAGEESDAIRHDNEVSSGVGPGR
jgi:hypothetical protein